MNISWSMNQKVQWATQTGELNAYAQPVYKPMGTICARVVRKVQLVKNQDGVDVASSIQVHVVDPVLIGDKITIGGRELIVITVADGIGLHDSGPSFHVLYL